MVTYIPDKPGFLPDEWPWWLRLLAAFDISLIALLISQAWPVISRELRF